MVHSLNKQDLEERTARFGEKVIEFVKKLPANLVTRPLISQLIRSSTSIGANYMEADAAESKNDFIHKIAIARKEAKESMHWIRMISVAENNEAIDCKILWKEAQELVLILSSIIIKSKNNNIPTR